MMRWPWNRPRPHPSDDAIAAVEQARRERQDMQAKGEKAREIADKLQATRERNHFATAVARIIEGHP